MLQNKCSNNFVALLFSDISAM